MVGKNRIVDLICSEDIRRWGGDFNLVELKAGEVLLFSNPSCDYVYFPINCIISLSSEGDDGQHADFALIGNEGVVGAWLFLGDLSNSYRATVEYGGLAFRLPIDVATKEVGQSGRFRISMLNYLQASITQSLQAAICDAKHSTFERLSRSLLMWDDRLFRNKVPLDQELIARSVGATVEQVAQEFETLEKQGFVVSSQGQITITNRLGLEKVACECYQLVVNEFDRLCPFLDPLSLGDNSNLRV